MLKFHIFLHIKITFPTEILYFKKEHDYFSHRKSIILIKAENTLYLSVCDFNILCFKKEHKLLSFLISWPRERESTSSSMSFANHLFEVKCKDLIEDCRKNIAHAHWYKTENIHVKYYFFYHYLTYQHLKILKIN